MKLVTCLLNISEARNKDVVKHIIESTRLAIEQTRPIGATILNAFCDTEYNRSVITVSGQLSQLEEAVVTAAAAALASLDLRHHEGGHPRLGVVDLIPLHPITEETTLADCDQLAHNIASRIVQLTPGAAFFKFSQDQSNSLIENRRKAGWFQSALSAGYVPHIGSYTARCGLTGIGAAPYMSNFNISLETRDMSVARRVLQEIREKTGGLPGVSAMAFPHHDNIEVACNVDMVTWRDNLESHAEAGNIEHVMGEFWRSKFSVIEDRVRKVADASGVAILGDSVIIGFTPEQSRVKTLEALSSGISCSVQLK